MWYKYLFLLLLTGCAVGEPLIETVGEVIIDEEIYAPLFENYNTIASIDVLMEPDDVNIPHFDKLINDHNRIIERIAIQIEREGTIIYEDYKLEILKIQTDLGILKDNYPNISTPQSIELILVPIIQDYIKKYARKIVARQIRKKLKY